jgi:recombination protein RecA
LEAQRRRAPAAWISVGRSSFYPPDMAENGVDLSALPVIWTADPTSAGRAADWLLRSSAFGLIIIDMQGGGRLPPGLQGRLVQLARKHRAALICLTGNAADPMGSLVSLRAEASWEKTDPSRFLCEIHVLKDKRRGPGWKHTEVCRGPIGLR